MTSPAPDDAGRTPRPDHATEATRLTEPDPGFVDLGYARLDTDRLTRTGDPEVVYGAGKTPDQVVDLLRHLHTAHPDRAALATRLDATALDRVRAAFPEARLDEVAGTATLGPPPTPVGLVCVLAAGTSDARVAREAVHTVEAYGAGVRTITDVGVAGVHRLLAAKEEFDDADCLIVVAGMEGALPSVVGGLTGVPLVAVPTSVGYGASFGGLAALLGMLNSCAPGVVVCNIDNGFGAGVFAARVARRAHAGRASSAAPNGEAPNGAAPNGEVSNGAAR
ncbi:nickel pincer cofactor biosynthesis protein LarB [Actinopolymorpha sp. NPDC004070]|uniref:nickel pincer cofactor biosynthesis protein LarB n=1 Tax=Actinopolymorpha sp. NPDC004070 TaxID=3154548 RepID=UPI0033B81063